MVYRGLLYTRFTANYLQKPWKLLNFRSNTTMGSPKPHKNYYKILGVQPTATQEEIRIAYLELSKKFHPDAAGKEQADKFVEATEAYSVLGKIESRREYDTNRNLFKLGLFGNGFRMTYPKPSKDIDPMALEAFNDEMRRRWQNRLDQWARSQAEYELERGLMMETVKSTVPYVSRAELLNRQTGALLLLVASFSCIAVMSVSWILLCSSEFRLIPSLDQLYSKADSSKVLASSNENS